MVLRNELLTRTEFQTERGGAEDPELKANSQYNLEFTLSYKCQYLYKEILCRVYSETHK